MSLRRFWGGQDGDITILNALIFLILALTMQSVSIYTAASLKADFEKPKTEDGKVSMPETFTENTETGDGKLEVSGTGNGKVGRATSEKPMDEASKKMIVDALKKRKNEGRKLEDLSVATGVSKSTLSKVLGYPAYQVGDEIFRKIAEKLSEQY